MPMRAVHRLNGSGCSLNERLRHSRSASKDALWEELAVCRGEPIVAQGNSCGSNAAIRFITLDQPLALEITSNSRANTCVKPDFWKGRIY
jgi:hypothetical protein